MTKIAIASDRFPNKIALSWHKRGAAGGLPKPVSFTSNAKGHLSLAFQLKQRDYHHSPNKDEHRDASRAEEIKSLPVREAEVVVVHGSVKSDVIHVAVDRKIATVLLVEIMLPNLRDNLLYSQKANRDQSRSKNDDLKYQQAFLLCKQLKRRRIWV
ncbi:hypothetical protein RE411_13920 [Agrobacterium pusense]|uniref:hypothetical protein n=1 Tax=Agrobacterium pusense TaxID=648995 RepID=UPI002867D4DE|nr:hypothetical protein [Agrobacterium pusense]WMW57104.1 hypothetical protein RE411_13920 [Agrobacterium pusense]